LSLLPAADGDDHPVELARQAVALAGARTPDGDLAAIIARAAGLGIPAWRVRAALGL
jgi:hypothetical protein